ncbi:uncharacterized protein LOC143423618 [Xylocopa sonorina]|uniref:uncharacterized protein LOC143423618 n=1 Tax=Xylocopa sonorina TaxID=1818115 RepID=UPI00403ADFB2
MSRSSLLFDFITAIINGGSKSRLTSMDTSVSDVSGGKRSHCEKDNGARNLLARDQIAGEHEARGKKRKTMDPEETVHLLCDRSVYEAVRFNGSKEKRKYAESVNDNFSYYAIDPVCMNVRLCIFWFLWVILIAVLIISILSYCCFTWKVCHDPEEIINTNTTKDT